MRTPSWLAPIVPDVAVEIASRRVTVVQISRAGGRPAITRQASEPLPPGLVMPGLNGQNIQVPEQVTAALERACLRAGLGVPSRAALIVPDSVARVSLVTLEAIPARAADLDQLLRWQLRKATPFPLEDAQISYFPVSTDGAASTQATVVARRTVIREYEEVLGDLGIHAGLVDLASFNVMNTVIGAGAAPDGDWLLVHLASEATSLAILRGRSLMFYRHRTAVDEEPLGSLVHQTAMYHEDRLGGGRFAAAWVSGVTDATDEARRQISDRLGIAVQPVDVRPAAALDGASQVALDQLDALAAPVGVLIRESAA